MKTVRRKLASWFIKAGELMLLDNKFPRLLMWIGHKLDVEQSGSWRVVRNRYDRRA